MKISDMHPGRFLKAEDAKGKPIVATIDYVELELVGQGADQKEKPVLHFSNGVRPMVLNVCNKNTIAKAFGEESEDWAEKRIEISCQKVDFGSKLVDGLRVRPIVAKAAVKADDEANSAF
jgi:hypothetical protein